MLNVVTLDEKNYEKLLQNLKYQSDADHFQTVKAELVLYVAEVVEVEFSQKCSFWVSLNPSLSSWLSL